MCLHTITQGELWLLRRALEEKDPDDMFDAIAVVESILEKNVTVDITEEQMYRDPAQELLSEEQAALIYHTDKAEEEKALDSEEEYHV